MKRILILVLTLYTSSLFAQELVFDWARWVGGVSAEFGKSIAVDDFGNVYTTGGFLNTSDFDPGGDVATLNNQGILDIFVSKLDSAGQFQWAVSFGDSFVDVGLGIATDAYGNVFVTGCYSGVVDFDPGPDVHYLEGNENVFVLKLDTNGSFLWVKSMGGIDDDEGEGIVVDEDGNVYVTGSFRGTGDFDPGPNVFNLSAVQLSDIFISKLDTNGNFVWAKAMGGNFSESGLSIALDEHGHVYTTGYFASTVDFDPSDNQFPLTALGIEDIYISKLTTDGDFVWVKNMGGAGARVRGSGIEIDESGSVYTTGKFAGGDVDFDPGVGVFNLFSSPTDITYFWNAFISKIDKDGNHSWAKSFGDDESFTEPNAIALDSNNDVYIVGNVDGTIDYNPEPDTYIVEANDDIFISKFETGGQFLWVGLLKGVGEDWGYSIALDGKFNIYTTGKILSPTDVNPTDQNGGSYAGEGPILIHKMNQPCAFRPTIKSATSSFSVCPKDSLVLLAEMPDCITQVDYFWNTGDSTDFLQVAPDSLTAYTVYANYINLGFSCFDSSSVDIFIYEPEPISIIGDSEHCVAEEFNLETTGASPFDWSTGDTTKTILTSTLEDQSYAVTATDVNGCFNTDSIFVSVNPLPSATISGQTEICPNDTTNLQATGGISYIWNTGSTTANLNVIPLLSETEYTVTVTDANGCTQSNTITITFNEAECPPCPVFPNAFTPDGDGVNDVFRILSGEKVEVLDFKIYNRWGTLIHNNVQPWNGSYENETQPMDTYIYKAVVKSQCGIDEFVGEVTLIR